MTLKVNTETLTDLKDIADSFNHYFASVFTSENLTHLLNFPQVFRTENLTQISTTPIQVGKLLRELNANKSCGPDDIHPRILKHCSYSLASPLCTLFNTSFKCGEIPDDWKTANVIPLYKKGAKDKVANYRPVSLTSIASKICEKIVRKSIVNFWTDHQVFIGEQFGFMKKRSCLSQLLDTFHSWAKARNDSHKVDVMLPDFTKAFGSVPHQRLLAKLKGYGIGGNLLNWLTHFIVGRKQRVLFCGHFSPWTMVTCGLPQGSVLG